MAAFRAANIGHQYLLRVGRNIGRLLSPMIYILNTSLVHFNGRKDPRILMTNLNSYKVGTILNIGTNISSKRN